MIVINLSNGFKLVAERNTDPEYSNEMYIGIRDEKGVWLQDLATIRNNYFYDSEGKVAWKDNEFEVLVYADKDNEDYTHKFNIDLYDGDE